MEGVAFFLMHVFFLNQHLTAAGQGPTTVVQPQGATAMRRQVTHRTDNHLCPHPPYSPLTDVQTPLFSRTHTSSSRPKSTGRQYKPGPTRVHADRTNAAFVPPTGNYIPAPPPQLPVPTPSPRAEG